VWYLCALVVATPATSARLVAQSRDAPQVTVSGSVLVHTFVTSSRTNNIDVPQFAVRRDGTDSLGDGGGLGLSVRQTRLAVRAFWPDLLGGELRTEIDADFFGGQQQNSAGALVPLFRVRRAVAEWRGDRSHVLIGQEVPLIAEHNPVTLASIGVSGLSGSGNLWLWLPQLRAGYTIAQRGTVRVGFDGAVVAPTSNEAAGALLRQPDRAEQSMRPAFEGRAVVRWGREAGAGEVSAGGHHGWMATAGDSLLVSRAVAVAARVPLGRSVAITGEWFRGQALAGLGGGGVGQQLGVGNLPVRTTGGWAQLVAQLPRSVEVAAGAGADDPRDAELAPAGRLHNRTLMASASWRPSPIVAALEVREIATRYRGGTARAVHLNVALGVTF
jgi:hypothetical protein